MKQFPPSVAAATPCLFATWYSAICLAAFLTVISLSAAADAQTNPEELNVAEKWVVECVTAGKPAYLERQFPNEENRKLRAHFLEQLLTGTLPGVQAGRNGVYITGAIIDEWVILRNAQIPFEAFLTGCQFRKPVTFEGASFGGRAVFSGSTFNAGAVFMFMKASQSAEFRNTVFRGANFIGMKVGDKADFQKAVFQGKVAFRGAEFGNLQAIEAEFKDEAMFDEIKCKGTAEFGRTVFRGANFIGMKVGDEAGFNKAVFQGKVIFSGAEFGNLRAIGAEFKDEAMFDEIKCKGTGDFGGALFEAGVIFFGAEFGNLRGLGAEFKDKALFDGIKCEGAGNFIGATFAGRVSFERSSFLDLGIGHMKSGAAPISRLDLSRSSIKRELVITKIAVDDFVAPSLHVEGPADFSDLIVEKAADLSDSDFAALNLTRSNWPLHAKDFHIQGMSYKYLRAAEEESESHRALLKLVSQSTYSADVYGNLEAFFKRQGYTADADRVFIAGKRRERSEYLHGLPWLGSLLIDWLVGYGRRPWQAGIPCLFFVALGCVLFSPRKMEPQKPENTPRVYSRFWYSLGLFLPFVDLQADKVWKPKADQTFLRNYMRVHILLGWILVPLVLAALTGLIK